MKNKIKKLFASLLILTVLVTSSFQSFALSQSDEENPEEYHILEGNIVFTEDFEGESLNVAYIPSNKFEVKEDVQGDKALFINGTGATVATNTFGPSLQNYLIEADMMLVGCNGSSNAGVYISARKGGANNSPAYNMLYAEINNKFGTAGVRDRLVIARSQGSYNIANNWYWTSMSETTGALDTQARTFSKFVHMKMYVSDVIIRLEMWDGETLLTSVEQLTSEIDTMSSLERLSSGNIQLGAHSCNVWYDNISIREISVIQSAEIKISATELNVGEEYDIWAENESGEIIPEDMIDWEYDTEKITILDGKIVVEEEGTFEIRMIYGGNEKSCSINAAIIEYDFEDYEVVIDNPNVFLGENINFYLKGYVGGKERIVNRNINCTTNAGIYNGRTLTTNTAGEHIITITYNNIQKNVTVYVSEYSAAEIRLESNEMFLGETTSFTIWATKNGLEERVESSAYTVTSDAGLVISGENVFAERTGEKKVYVVLDRVEIETVLSVNQLVEGTIIEEDFEDDWYSEFFEVPEDDVILDSDGNKVYRLCDEFSPFYGDTSWYNYKINGKVKIINSSIENNRYNTSFSIYYRQQIPEDSRMTGGQYGIPAVYCMDEEHQYLRIGSQNGANFEAMEGVWYDFSVEAYGEQQIFSIGDKKICFPISIKEDEIFIKEGGFVFNAENIEVYLDDIVVQRMDVDTFENAVELEIENSGVNMDVFENKQLTSLFAVRAVDENGNYRYVGNEAEYEIVSDNAEIVSDSLAIRIDPVTTENVRVKITYGSLNKEAIIKPTKAYNSRTDYLKDTQDIRNKNFCYKMLRSASTLGVLDESQLFCLSYVSSILALQPTRRSYDQEIEWLINIGESQSEQAGVASNVDFVVNVLLVLRHELKDFVNVSSAMWEQVDEFIKNEYYGSSTTMISENHRIMNLTDAYLIAELFPNDILYGGKTGSQTAEEYAEYILDWMNFRYKYGMTEYDSTYLGVDMVALETICNYTANETMRHECKEFLNWLYADSVIDSMGDRLTGAHGRTYFNSDVLAKMYNLAQRFEIEETKWTETVGAYGVQPAIYAFINTDLDDAVYELANVNKTGLVNKEKRKIHHLPDDEEMETLCKYTYFGDGYAMGCLVNYENPFNDSTLSYVGDKYYNEEGIWVAGGHQEISMTATIEGNDKRFITFGQPGPKGASDSKSKHSYYSGFYNYPAFNYMQHENTTIGVYYIADDDQLQYTHCYIPTEQFDAVDEENGWIFLRSNDVYTAIRPLKAGTLNGTAYRWGDNITFTSSNILLSENEILLEDEYTGFVMQMSSQEESGKTFEEFKTTMKQTQIEYSLDNNGTLSYTTYQGDTLKVVYDTGEDILNGVVQNYSNWKLFDSEYIQGDYNSISPSTVISVGEKELTIGTAMLETIN